jgi:tetratricopeptide (TPR) repeat protein
MVLAGRRSGITCDEVLHYNQSVSVNNYFDTNGEDQSALYTPVTHLKYYGQSYDNLVTKLIQWFDIDDIYGFRHLMSSLAGWLAIFVTALFTTWLSGYGTGIFVLILFAVSPSFMGHAGNNLKDIPFALGYIAGTYYTLRFVTSERKIPVTDIILLTASIAFSISIRAGGLLLICNLILFLFSFSLYKYLNNNKFDFRASGIKLLWVFVISILAWLLSTLYWPFALQSPVKNILESYNVMSHFPDTFRQIFEGKVEWSDFMPWYYLPKSMLITVPLIVLIGLALFAAFSLFRPGREKSILYGFVIFTILFPVFFVIYKKSNLYSSWRQLLFLYPAIVLIASTGFHYLVLYLKKPLLKTGIILFFALLAIHPLKFMIKNQTYWYLYYNQIVGGLQGAYGNYETDYYYVSQAEASAWLIGYLKEKNIKYPVKVKATFSVAWSFRKHPEIESSYFRFQERSQSDWDYAIVVNRYIPPFQLKNNIWPPENSIHVIYADKVPVCAVIERQSKDDFYGYVALNEERNKDAIRYFENVLKLDDKDEMIFFNFAAALYKDGHYFKADSVLRKGLDLNPDFEPILMYLGNIAKSQNRPDEAILFYERLIRANRKYFEAYVVLSGLLIDKDIMKARALLRRCLEMTPGYKPAIIALADTYRKSDPGIAKKYDELANTIK